MYPYRLCMSTCTRLPSGEDGVLCMTHRSKPDRSSCQLKIIIIIYLLLAMNQLVLPFQYVCWPNDWTNAVIICFFKDSIHLTTLGPLTGGS